MITFRNSQCSCCNKSIPDDMLFCNQCQSHNMAYLDIAIANSWARYISTRKDNAEKIQEILKYADRHGYRFDLVRLKLFCRFNIIVEVGKKEIHLLPDFGGRNDTNS